MKSEDKQTCFLLLEDGTVLPGESFGARNHIDGEVGKQHVVLIGYVFGMDNT
jgi:carbamoylphosphate synthase small subunit